MRSQSAAPRRWAPASSRWLVLLLLLGLLSTSCAGPGSGESPATSAAAQPRTFVDQAGQNVTIAHERPLISASIGAYAQIVAMLGGEDQLVATITGLSETFRKVWPRVNPEGHDAANVEDVIASGAQVAIGPSFTDEQRAQLTAAGVVPITISQFATVEQMKSVVALIGDIVGGDAPAKAAAFTSYYDQNIAFVRERTAALPADQRVKVLNLRYSGGAYSTVPGNDISVAYAEAAGGDVVSKDVAGGATGSAPQSTVNAEQIIAWAPEVIFTMGAAAHKQITGDPALATVPAVAKGRVHIEPAGTYPWGVRSAEGALEPLFLATILHPALFADLSLQDRTRDFYQRFYGYSLTDAELAAILAGSR